MTYFKLICNNSILGVGSTFDLRKVQKKHNILLASDEDSAQYIQFKDKLYRDDWFKSVDSDFEYETVKIIAIDETEYNALSAAIQANEDVQEWLHEQEPEKEESEVQEDITSVDFVRASKIAEMNEACNKTITDGFDIDLSDGIIHHFSLTVQDQINLITVKSMDGDSIPYHADGELCRYFTKEDMQAVIDRAAEFKTYHVTYFNSLRNYINALKDINKISKLEYGVNIPKKYQSQILKDIS